MGEGGGGERGGGEAESQPPTHSSSLKTSSLSNHKRDVRLKKTRRRTFGPCCLYLFHDCCW